MDERTYDPANNEGTNIAEAPVENNAPETPAPVTDEVQPTAIKKSNKDFTPEERKAILARAAKVDLARAAKEFNTSWQAIAALQKAEQRAKLKAKQKPAAKVKKAKTAKTAAATKVIKKSGEFSQKEKDAILAKARVHGFREVAAEYGTNWQTLASWNKQQKNMTASEDKAKVKNRSRAKKAVEGAAVSVAAASKPEVSVGKSKNMSAEELEIENAILKEKLAILTQQVEKLRIAVGSLA